MNSPRSMLLLSLLVLIPFGGVLNPSHAAESSKAPLFTLCSTQTYRAPFLPYAKITLDGRAGESAWTNAPLETHFVFPWKPAEAPPTEFRALCTRDYLYFTFRVTDADIVVLEKPRYEEDEVFEDRGAHLDTAPESMV